MLAPVSEDPFKLTNVDYKTVLIKRPDRSVERVSSPKVFMAPKPKKVKNVNDIVKPFPVTKRDLV